MKLLFNIGHPAHVHLFKNVIWDLETKGHEVQIAVIDKEITLHLLDSYGFDYNIIGKNVEGLAKKMYDLLKKEHKLLRISKNFKPDLLISTGSPYAAHVSKLISKPHIAFGDTEIAKSVTMLMKPFTDVICTPSCFNIDLGPKQVRYNGYHELAYLHPNYFQPNKAVLDHLRIDEQDVLIILRFASKTSSHDTKDKGFGFKANQDILTFIKELEKYGTIVLTSEIKLNANFDKYKLKISPEKIHDLLSFATIYIGDGATMASESGVLGVPSIFISQTGRGYLEDLERYGLTYMFSNVELAKDKIFTLLSDNNLKNKYQIKREKLLSEKIDVTAFFVNFIEHYPQSFYEYQRATKAWKY